MSNNVAMGTVVSIVAGILIGILFDNTILRPMQISAHAKDGKLPIYTQVPDHLSTCSIDPGHDLLMPFDDPPEVMLTEFAECPSNSFSPPQSFSGPAISAL